MQLKGAIFSLEEGGRTKASDASTVLHFQFDTGFQVLKTCFGAILEQVNCHFGAAKQCFKAEGFIVWSNKVMFPSKRILNFKQQSYVLEGQKPNFSVA